MDRFFEDSYNEENIVDEQPEEIIEEDVSNEEIVDSEDVSSDVEEVPTVVEIDGETYTLDEIKNGMMRQSDYTRKTQELANQRKDVEEAIMLQEFLKANPDALRVLQGEQSAIGNASIPNEILSSIDPIVNDIKNIKRDMQIQQIENEVTRLTTKYPDFDERIVLEKALEMGITDLEFVYKGLRNEPSQEDMIAKAKAELKKELIENKGITKTVIKEEGSQNTQEDIVLTSSERRIADVFGMSAEEYAENK